jgi:transcriptional regulator of arginine metabolism
MRKKRLSAILQIIREHEIENQDMLISELNKLGFVVTQATISRDINDLGLEKSLSESGVSRYAKRSAVKGQSASVSGIFTQAVISADYVGNTVVLKCRQGWAGAVCDAFDRVNYAEVVGTLAGDDTIFILTRTEKQAKELYEKIFDLL